MVTENKNTTGGMGTNRTTRSSMMPANEVFDIAGMVDYAEGSIVSRTLIESKAGTVTLFAFDAGQSLSEHTAPFDALILILDGEGEFTVGGKAHRVATGKVLLMPADIPHAVKAEEPFKMLLTMLRSI